MERIISGYCRAQDQARTIMLEYDEGEWDYACDYPDCAFSSGCSLAKELQAIMEEYK